MDELAKQIAAKVIAETQGELAVYYQERSD